VSRISKEPGEPFITIEATPTAKLNQSRMLLVVFQALVPDNQRAENQLEPGKGSTRAVDGLQEER
jgi:rod shape-determining protein MreC